MNKVTKKPIGKLVNVYNNIRVPLSSKQRENIDKIYPYYGAQGIVDFVDDFLFDGQYLLVAEDGENLRSNNQNICNLVNGKFWVNNHAHILQANSLNDIKYLFYNFNLINFEPFVTGSAQPKLNKENLLSIETFVHELEDQQKIASVLSSLDNKIELNNKINTELEAIAKTLYDYWFVQFEFPVVTSSGVEKPYKTSGGKMLFNETLKREIPEGWEVINLFDSAKVQYGFPFSTDYFNEDGNGVPVIRIRDILENSISNYSIQKDLDEKYLIENGDLLIGMDGNFHINYWSKDNCYLNQRVVMIKEKKLSNMITRYQIEPYIQLREKSVSRTTVGHLSDKDLKRLFLIVPSNSTLEKINPTFDNILKKVIANRKQNQELATLRDWLLPMLMNGQVTVNDVEDLQMVAEPSSPYMASSHKNDDELFELWLQEEKLAARGDIDRATLREMFDAMDDEDKY